jgi:hypothetical protein
MNFGQVVSGTQVANQCPQVLHRNDTGEEA